MGNDLRTDDQSQGDGDKGQLRAPLKAFCSKRRRHACIVAVCYNMRRHPPLEDLHTMDAGEAGAQALAQQRCTSGSTSPRCILAVSCMMDLCSSFICILSAYRRLLATFSNFIMSSHRVTSTQGILYTIVKAMPLFGSVNLDPNSDPRRRARPDTLQVDVETGRPKYKSLDAVRRIPRSSRRASRGIRVTSGLKGRLV